MTKETDTFYRNWHNMIVPEGLEVDQDTHTASFGKFTCQPLERGFATTIGNTMRRILLSSIYGTAITSVKIDGVLHELSTIPGIKEDATEIILNLKEVRLRLNANEPRTVRIEKKKKGVVTAGDITGDGMVEVLNPEQHICTITGDGKFNAELEVSWGKGYVTAERNKKEEQEIGVIAIDSIFTPVLNVKVVTSQARVGQQTDYDKLTLEISTDGGVRPEDALAYAAKILKEQMQVFINFDEEAIMPLPSDSGAGEKPKLNENLYRSVEDLELSVRSANCLRNAEIRHIGELVQKTEAEMLKTKNFGRKSLNEIKQLLSEMDLYLGMKIEGWVPPADDQEKEE